MTHNSWKILRKLVMAIAALSATSLLPNATNVVRGQRLSEDSRVFGGPERKLYNGVPAKLPLAFAVRNVTSERWVHDLEIEVTNTSDKPIYYMDMYVFLVGVKGPEGSTIGYWLKYGRIQLISFLEPVLPEDVSIAPGEKYTFKISKSDAKSWEVLKAKEGRAEPKSLKLLIQRINFGDGTGFRTTSGKPVNIHRKVSRAGPSRLASLW